MTTLDQFESVFKSAVKPSYKFERVQIDRVLIVTDLHKSATSDFSSRVQHLLLPQEIKNFEVIAGHQYNSTIELLNLVNGKEADLICCYRNLHSRAWQYPHSLGSHLDVLIQQTAVPVLILPHPEAGYEYAHAYDQARRVLAMTDHMTDDNKLVSHAVEFAGPDGYACLAHIEDEATFSRYIEAIGKIETIDTANARSTIRNQLIKNPREYIESARKVLSTERPGLRVDDIVAFGDKLKDYLGRVDELRINMLLLHGKVDGQLAMRGISYPIAVELREIPVMII